MPPQPSNENVPSLRSGAVPLLSFPCRLKYDPPIIRCRRLATPIVGGDWNLAERVLADATPIPLQQAWLARSEPQFQPATVRTGWWDETLWVLADLHDADIFNPVVESNVDFFQHGDVFEMFLRPAAQDGYYEFHVGPQNQKLQLRIPSTAAFRQSPPAEQREWKLISPTLQSWVDVDLARHRWQVMTAVPFAGICESRAALACREWFFSFSRYDYTQAGARPCLSSTSPHVKVDFHRQEEWGKLCFVF